jgi:hypothetical protein
MNYIKKKGLINLCAILILMMTMTTYYADEYNGSETSGKYYITDINAYINGKYIDSWNINGRTYINIDELSNYGYEVVKNDDIGVTKILSNYHSDREAIVYESIAYTLYEGYDEVYGDFIDYVEPSYEIVGTMHGSIELIGSAKDTVTIHFSKAVKEEYMNAKYIPIYYRDKNVSKYFSYNYNTKFKQLTIKIKPGRFSDYKTNNEEFCNGSGIFTIYLLNGIKDKSGIMSDKIFKYKVRFDLDMEDRMKVPSKFAWEYKSINEKVYVVGERGDVKYDIYLLDNGKKVICIEALGDFYWDETRRNIYVYSKTYLENINREYISKLKEVCKPVYEDTFENWIKSTKPNMTLEKTVYNGTVEKISSNKNEIVISFNKSIKEEYINENYIHIYRKDKPVNNWFAYNYDKETNTLKLRLKEINGKINVNNNFSRILYDQNGNIIENYVGSRFDIYIIEGIIAEDGDVLQDSLKLTCDVTWQPDGDESLSNRCYNINGKVKEITTWNINGTKILSFKEYGTRDSIKKEYEDSYAIVEPLNEKPWQYYRRIAKPLFKGFVDDWIEYVTPITELVKGEKESVIEIVNNTSSDIIIVFKKEIDERYINNEYIKIFSATNDVSHIFKYIYDKENKKLTIKKAKDVALYRSEDQKYGNTYDIYLMKGLTSTKGEKLVKPIRITVGMVWK